MAYEITQRYIKKNRPGSPLNPKGGVLHNTANLGDTDESEYEYFANNNVGASAHAFIDWDSITNIIPWSEVAWHAGPTANRQYWGVELCTTDDPGKFNEIWKRAVWLYAWLFKNQGITSINRLNLRSHAEVSREWKETDHQDPVDYFAKFSVNMDMFRDAVQKCINSGNVQDLKKEGLIFMVLKKGDNNPVVASLQTQLKRLGHDIIPDGDFGAKTEAAVRLFQLQNDLTVDGVVGPTTDGAISDAVKKLSAPVPAAPVSNIPGWKVDGAQYLKDAGLTSELHPPLETVDIGTLGTILKKLATSGK